MFEVALIDGNLNTFWAAPPLIIKDEDGPTVPDINLTEFPVSWSKTIALAVKPWSRNDFVIESATSWAVAILMLVKSSFLNTIWASVKSSNLTKRFAPSNKLKGSWTPERAVALDVSGP